MLRASDGPPDERERRPLLTGASLSAAAQVCTALTGALVGLLLARTLGPAGLGSYNLLVSLMVLLVAAGTCGVDFGASFLVSRREWGPAEAARQIQVGALILGIAAFLLGCGAFAAGRSTIFTHLEASDVLLLLSCLPFAISMQITAALAVAVERYELAAAGPALQSVISLGLVAILASSFGLTGAVGGFVASYVLMSIGLAWRMTRSLGPGPRDWLRSMVKTLRLAARFGFGVSLTNALGQLVQRIDLFVLSAFVTAATLGRYSLAFGLTSVQLLLPRALGQVILPRVASLGPGGQADQRAVAKKGLRHAVILTTCTGLVMAALLPLVPLVYGSDFTLTVYLAEALVPGVAVAGLTSVTAPLLVAHGHPRDVTALGIAGLGIACCFYAALIPSFGAWGAAVASTVSYVILGSLYAWALRRRGVVDALSDWLPRGADFRDYASLARGLRSRALG